VGEFVPGYEVSAVFGIVGPKNMADDIVEELNREINAGLADPKYQGAACSAWRYGACRLGCRLRQAFRRRNREVGKVIRAANLKAE
jgi:tripartite-type tricarboxylate transporter receptor subunit TctC